MSEQATLKIAADLRGLLAELCGFGALLGVQRVQRSSLRLFELFLGVLGALLELMRSLSCVFDVRVTESFLQAQLLVVWDTWSRGHARRR